MDFKNRKILVTGGSRGIGFALTSRLVALGANVIIIGRDQNALDDAIGKFPSGKITGLQADLSIPEEVDQLIADISSQHPDLSMLINNAAIQTEMDLIAGEVAKNTANMRLEIALNIHAPMALSIGLLPVIANQKSAAIVNVTTGLALSPKQNAPVYCATKAGLRSFSKGLRYQCEEHASHIMVSEVIMSLVDTQMTKGRGSGKISADQAAAEIVSGLAKNQTEIWIGKTKLLRIINRIAPSIAAKILR